MFAKLYETKYGQILVKRDSSPDEDGEEIRYFFQPDGFGVCSLAITFSHEDEEKRFEAADKAWEKVTEESAIKVIENIGAKMDLTFLGLDG